MILRRCSLAIAFYAAGVCALTHQSQKSPKSPLPTVKQVLSRPHDVQEKLSSHVQDLALHLAELQSANTEEVSEEKARYEEKLRLQREEAAATQSNNTAIRSHIEHLREDSAKVRKQTVALVQTSRHLVEQLNAMRENFTEADAVITNVLGEAKEKMTSSPKLQVLQELVQNDTRISKEIDNQRRFDEIVSPLALLQVRSEPGQVIATPQTEARELVESLMASLGTLSEEQNVSSASLKKNFEDDWDAGIKRQSSLLAEQTELNATDAREQELNTKLHAALQHATELRTHLKARLGAIKHFAKKVGSRPMPEAGPELNPVKQGAQKKKKKKDGKKTDADKKKKQKDGKKDEKKDEKTEEEKINDGGVVNDEKM